MPSTFYFQKSLSPLPLIICCMAESSPRFEVFYGGMCHFFFPRPLLSPFGHSAAFSSSTTLDVGKAFISGTAVAATAIFLDFSRPEKNPPCPQGRSVRRLGVFPCPVFPFSTHLMHYPSIANWQTALFGNKTPPFGRLFICAFVLYPGLPRREFRNHRSLGPLP